MRTSIFDDPYEGFAWLSPSKNLNFHDFSIFFQAWILDGFFYGFGEVFGVIWEAFGGPWAPKGRQGKGTEGKRREARKRDAKGRRRGRGGREPPVGGGFAGP